MSKDKLIDHNATPIDETDGLRGGTQGGGIARLIEVGDKTSNATASNPAGPSQGRSDATPSSADESDSTDIISDASGDQSRHESPAHALRSAREQANIPPELAQSGFNEGDKAIEDHDDVSSGTRASTLGRVLDADEQKPNRSIEKSEGPAWDG